MKIMKLGERERWIFLTALGYDMAKKFRCQYCKDEISWKDCGIFPAIKTKKYATLLCNSPLCVTEYLEDVETWSEKNE